MSGIRFIYFDLDDTLLDHGQAERKALADLRNAFPNELGAFPLTEIQETYHNHNIVVWRRYGQGDLTKEDVKNLRFALLLEALGIETLSPRALNDRYLQYYANHWDYCEGARSAFHALAERYPVGILTNGFSEIQHAKLARFPELYSHLSALIISEEIGYMKPHPKLFAHATAAAGLPAASILYIGDSYHSDVEGARNAGWQVAWYTQDGQDTEGVFRFRHWNELLWKFMS